MIPLPRHLPLDLQTATSQAGTFAPGFMLHLTLARGYRDASRREIACLGMIRAAAQTTNKRDAHVLWQILHNHLVENERTLSTRLLKIFEHFTPNETQKDWALSAVESRTNTPSKGFGSFTPAFLITPRIPVKEVT